MDFITVLAIVAGIVWLGLMLVAALRNRGGEEVAPNLQTGIDDQRLETTRLEKSQKVAIVGSAFLAISLPLYFLGETNRQEGFVEEFAHESVERGEHIVEEFACFGCHGPLGVGGVASYVEKRSGVSVDWIAPALDDVLYRHDEDELSFWITFGRANTPMPPWGLAGGGPLNEAQVLDVISYLKTIQIDQAEAVQRSADSLPGQLTRLETADATVEAAILNQRQVVAEIEQATADAAFIGPLSEEARDILDTADEGLDTDDDGLSDNAETELSALTAKAVAHYRVVDTIILDPAAPDAEKVDEALAEMETASATDPILEKYIVNIRRILATAATGEDTDGDGISDEAEAQITGQVAEASGVTIPSGISEITLDPRKAETVTGVPDATAGSRVVGSLESIAIQARVAAATRAALLTQEEGGLEFLIDAQRVGAWEIDIAGVAAAMGVSEAEVKRAVALYQVNCARCHTAGFSAGVPYTLEAGSGGFGPALWDGRPVIQFGEKPGDPEQADLLVDFLIKGSEPQKPYGLNGFGSGRMPSFGATLPMEDIELLAAYLRSGNMDGRS